MSMTWPKMNFPILLGEFHSLFYPPRRVCKNQVLAMQEPGSAGGCAYFTVASTRSMKQPASVTMKKPRKANANPSLKFHVKFGGSKHDQSNQPSLTENKLSTESCINLARTPRQSSPTKGGLGRRYKLLSDVLS